MEKLLKSKYFGVGSRLFGNESASSQRISGILSNKNSHRRIGWSGYYDESTNTGYSMFRYSRGHGSNTKHIDFFRVPNDIGNEIIKDMQKR